MFDIVHVSAWFLWLFLRNIFFEACNIIHNKFYNRVTSFICYIHTAITGLHHSYVTVQEWSHVTHLILCIIFHIYPLCICTTENNLRIERYSQTLHCRTLIFSVHHRFSCRSAYIKSIESFISIYSMLPCRTRRLLLHLPDLTAWRATMPYILPAWSTRPRKPIQSHVDPRHCQGRASRISLIEGSVYVCEEEGRGGKEWVGGLGGGLQRI